MQFEEIKYERINVNTIDLYSIKYIRKIVWSKWLSSKSIYMTFYDTSRDWIGSLSITDLEKLQERFLSHIENRERYEGDFDFNKYIEVLSLQKQLKNLDNQTINNSTVKKGTLHLGSRKLIL